MANADPTEFTRLSDGTLLLRQPDGAFLPVTSDTDRAKLAALSDEEIERMAVSDPDHPGLDADFWDRAAASVPGQEAISLTLDADVLRYFREDGRSYHSHINAVLRTYVDARRKGSPP